MIHNSDIDDGPLSSKCHKVCCCHSCCFPCNPLFYPCRKAVSGKKVRMEKDGFSLDLTYLDTRIIVHGFPSTGIEHMYRNPRYEIRRFLDTKHPEHYKLYNFCCEPGRGYSPEIFHGRSERYPFKDHNTPPLATMIAFGESVKQWLDADPANVVSMHCKAGKGRAGLMSCVALIRSGVVQSAIEALDLYDKTRVTNNRGLTVTSQRKWVIFYEALWREVWGVSGDIGAEPSDMPVRDHAGADMGSPQPCKFLEPEQPYLKISAVQVLGVNQSFKLDDVRIMVFRLTNFSPEQIFDSKKGFDPDQELPCDCVIHGNFKIVVQVYKGALSGYKKLFELMHNTYFMDSTAEYVDFGMDQLDVKRKLKAKIGAAAVLRLRVCRTTAPPPERNRQSVTVAADAVYRRKSVFSGSAKDEPYAPVAAAEVELTEMRTVQSPEP